MFLNRTRLPTRKNRYLYRFLFTFYPIIAKLEIDKIKKLFYFYDIFKKSKN